MPKPNVIKPRLLPLLLPALLSSGCATVSPSSPAQPPMVVGCPRVPALPASARQSTLSEPHSARAQRDIETWLSTPTETTAPASPASSGTTR